MKDTASRVFVLMLVLVGVWVLTYWLYEPGGGEAKVTFDAGYDDADDAAMDEPFIDPTSGAPLGATDRTLVPPPPPPPHPMMETAGAGERVPVLVPPEFGTYIVQEGDRGWEDIAQKVYGDRSLWWAVSKSNQLATSDKLIPGVTKLRYALDPTNIQGRVEYQEVPFPGVAGAGETEPARPAGGENKGYVEHVITERDTLWDLAKAYYGKGHLYTRIVEANRDVITDPDRPPIGATIKIPPMENE